jgi:hypothetical protein
MSPVATSETLASVAWIADGTEMMAPWSEVVVDDGVRRKKVLRLAG